MWCPRDRMHVVFGTRLVSVMSDLFRFLLEKGWAGSPENLCSVVEELRRLDVVDTGDLVGLRISHLKSAPVLDDNALTFLEKALVDESASGKPAKKARLLDKVPSAVQARYQQITDVLSCPQNMPPLHGLKPMNALDCMERCCVVTWQCS